MRKLTFFALLAVICFSACKNDNENSEPTPSNDTTPIVDSSKFNPNSYRYLKTYVDRAVHPNFKFSGALDVNDFHNNRSGVRDTVTAHFDEIVAGNAMKYSSVVSTGGNMNFDRVKTFVDDAKKAGLSIYGHTLAWHSQQQPGYLLGLMADREEEDPDADSVEVVDFELNYGSLKKYEMWHADFKDASNNMDFNVEIVDNMLHVRNNELSKETWNVQYKVAQNIGVKTGHKYILTIKLKASESVTLPFSIGDWYPNCCSSSIEATNEMKEHQVEIDSIVNGDILFQTGGFVGDIYFESIKISHITNTKRIPLTAEQKRDTLVWAMDRWIAGMMEATDGYVKAWDVVNEALSGGGNDGSGNYVLQNYENNNISDPSNVSSGVFYWQAFMGDLEYVRTAVASARKHFKGNADELKLFVNDYNLESDWDDNKKVKSLVEWIKKWEADGVTKIDGIGTQMHISCFEDASIQKSIENHIVKMFEIMAASGKLCRISELDMGYVRGNQRWGSASLKTSQVTEAEHQKMADFYEFIVKKYFEIIPVEQQYGICQWCLTDAPSNSGWRGGEPVGIWTEGFKARKAAFIGFAKGLSGEE